MFPPKPDPAASPVDPAARLATIFHDFPGLRALIMRRVGDAQVAADILQDAAVTTLEKLRDGQIEDPENVGGYLYRVALNHLRNYRRKERRVSLSSGDLEYLPVDDSGAFAAVGEEWAEAARRVLEAMPNARDREVLVRFYLNEEEREQICRDLGLSPTHFSRVIYRARNRFREVLERFGIAKSDLLSIALLGLVIVTANPPLFGARL